MGHLRGS